MISYYITAPLELQHSLGMPRGECVDMNGTAGYLVMFPCKVRSKNARRRGKHERTITYSSNFFALRTNRDDESLASAIHCLQALSLLPQPVSLF